MLMMPKHTPRALITGASSGIGQVYAKLLALTGHDLVIVARRSGRLEELARELRADHSIKVEVLAADLGYDEGVARVVDRIENGTEVDLLVNNAGYAARGKVAELDPDALEAMLRVNVFAMSRLSRSAMGRMIAMGRGSIINIASATAFLLLSGNAGYGASKSFVLAFTRHMQLEAKGTGVIVQALIPGVISTDFHRNAGADLGSFPPERVMTPEDLVIASLQALEMGELVCMPSLPEIKDWDAYVIAEQTVAGNLSRDRIASRYYDMVGSL
jgi:short-subunit dehydrogenase